MQDLAGGMVTVLERGAEGLPEVVDEKAKQHYDDYNYIKIRPIQLVWTQNPGFIMILGIR